MSHRLVRQYKWFWDDADHAIEDWLEEMARQGLHLRQVRWLRSLFVFERGEPALVAYRLDFRVGRRDPHYLQLFNDAGWEHVDELLGWHYWRTPLVPGRTSEIFSDVGSAIKKYQQVLCLFALVWLFAAIALPYRYPMGAGLTPEKLAPLLASMGVTLYATVRLVRRIRKLRQQVP